MTDQNQTQDPQTAAMMQGIASAQQVGAEAAERHQKALEQAVTHHQNVVQVMTNPHTANLPQAQINRLVRASPQALAKALREISYG